MATILEKTAGLVAFVRTVNAGSFATAARPIGASPSAVSGYQRLSGYVLNVSREHRATTDPTSWTRLGAYILDTSQEGEKVAWARATNCGSDDPGWAVRDILATQEQNTRSKSDKSYHLVVSFPEGERPAASRSRISRTGYMRQRRQLADLHLETASCHG